MPEVDPLISSYSHLAEFPRAKEALHTLKKIASMVKPIMRARGWKVRQLHEFYPDDPRLLGLNVNRQRIYVRLRYSGDCTQFYPFESVLDTMLHELAHMVHSAHDAKFDALWDQLRDEHESLTLKGYTGEGFMSDGHRLGGQRLSKLEAKRLARVAAEKRRTRNAGSGQRLGGAAPRPGQDIRKVITDAVERRNRITSEGCANGNRTQDEIQVIANAANRNGFRTQAEEDAANEAAIAQALWELVQEDKKAEQGDACIPPDTYLPGASEGESEASEQNRREQPQAESAAQPLRISAAKDADVHPTWACDICTFMNPVNFLCCDMCGTERTEATTRELLAAKPAKRQRTTIDLTAEEDRALHKPVSKRAGTEPSSAAAPTRAPKPRTWTCHMCGRVRERVWWTCDICGAMKLESK
ncbi:WLM-domain-containing protein [Xylariaceae sp. FL0016]|nr:WLM-domain-containing protein [Xylariaceae sp. FL0016]